MKMKIRKRKKLVCIVTTLMIMILSSTVCIQAKTITVKKVTDSQEIKGKIYYPKKNGVITSDLMCYNTKNKKVTKFINKTGKYMSFSSISAKGKFLYAIVQTNGGTGNPVSELVRINQKTKKITSIANTFEYYYYHNRIYFEEYKERGTYEYDIEMYPTGKILSVNLQGKDKRVEKNIKIKVKGGKGSSDEKIKQGKYKYYLNSAGTKLYEKNVKTNKKKCIIKLGSKMKIWKFEVTQNHIIITATMNNYSQKYNTRMYITDLKGKSKKIIAKWYEQ